MDGEERKEKFLTKIKKIMYKYLYTPEELQAMAANSLKETCTAGKTEMVAI